jgi:hypothetical protein
VTDKESTGLLAALRAVQNDAPALPKDKTNPHFKSKYTGLDTIIEKIGPLLDRHGLVWTALPSGTHEQPTLSYRLAHVETGEALEGTMPLLLDKPTAQALGSALTYARRYSLCAVLNLVTDEDDDGNSASSGYGKPAKKPTPARGKATRAEITSIYQAGVGLTQLELLNVLRSVYGAKPLAASEEDAKVRLEAGMVNLMADKVPTVLAKIAEAKGA